MRSDAPIGVVGGNGRIGRLLLARLAARGLPAAALVREPARAKGLPRGVELRGPAEFAGLAAVACCTPASAVPGLVAALPDPSARLVVLGSTRRYSRFPDPVADEVLAAEALVLARPASLIVHTTMIYGAAGENNVQRVAALIRRGGVLPLPGGGRSLIQPIHAEDVAACLEAALLADPPVEGVLVAAGPEAVTWANFARAIAAAAGLGVRILPVPLGLARAAAAIARLVPGLPSVEPGELQRLLEDKEFDIGPMRAALGVTPRPLKAGLAETFADGGDVQGGGARI